MSAPLPLSGSLPSVNRLFDNANMSVFAHIMCDRYRFAVSDMDVTCETQSALRVKMSLQKSFRAGVGKDAFLLIDGLRGKGLVIESITYVMPEDSRKSVNVDRFGEFRMDPSCDREEIWSILTQCVKGRGSGHRLQLVEAGPTIRFSRDELAMVRRAESA